MVGGPTPVFEHLGRGFDEVTNDGGSVEAGVFGFGDEVVDTVAELMEEGSLYTIKSNQVSASSTHGILIWGVGNSQLHRVSTY